MVTVEVGMAAWSVFDGQEVHNMTNRGSICADLITMAERELSAFFHAVTELFGPEQAKASADDWVRELMASDNLPASARQWRTFTIAAAARLAARVNALSGKE